MAFSKTAAFSLSATSPRTCTFVFRGKRDFLFKALDTPSLKMDCKRSPVSNVIEMR